MDWVGLDWTASDDGWMDGLDWMCMGCVCDESDAHTYPYTAPSRSVSHVSPPGGQAQAEEQGQCVSRSVGQWLWIDRWMDRWCASTYAHICPPTLTDTNPTNPSCLITPETQEPGPPGLQALGQAGGGRQGQRRRRRLGGPAARGAEAAAAGQVRVLCVCCILT